MEEGGADFPRVELQEANEGPAGVSQATDFQAQQRHLHRLVVSLDTALSSLAPLQSKPAQSSSATQNQSHSTATGKPVNARSFSFSNTDTTMLSRQDFVKVIITPESAAALVVEALVAVKASLVALARHDSPPDKSSRHPITISKNSSNSNNSNTSSSCVARELQAALARAIRALRNACVGTASSTAELLGGEDPTGFAHEVRALAEAHEKELEDAMAEEEPKSSLRTKTPNLINDPDVAMVDDEGGTGSGGSTSFGVVGSGFWARQSDLWSGVFAEQQTGLLQMVRAQEAELRQGKRRISALEEELSALNVKQAEAKEAAAAAAKRETAAARPAGKRLERHEGQLGKEGERGPLKELEADEWRQRLQWMEGQYDVRVSAVREREETVVTAEKRVEDAATELGAERDQLKAGAVALSAEADALRYSLLLPVVLFTACCFYVTTIVVAALALFVDVEVVVSYCNYCGSMPLFHLL